MENEEVANAPQPATTKKKFQHPKKSAEEQKQEKENRKKRRARIIIRNISYKLTKAKLQEHFAKFGQIEDVNLLQRPDGKLVGCAFVQFAKVNQAAKAILKTTGKELLGRVVQVDWAIEKDKYSKHLKKSKKLQRTNVSEEVKIEDAAEEDSSDAAEEEIKEEIKEEDEDSDDDDGEEESSDEKDNKEDTKADIKNILNKKTPKISNDVSEGCTVFIKNIPFEATQEDLRKCCVQFGALYYALINVDHVSGHSKGTGFVKYRTKESADMCLSAGTEFQLLQQVLDPCLALSRTDIKTKYQNEKQKVPADSRNLYLAKEGCIVAGTPAAEGVSAADMAKRLRLERIKTQMFKNLNRFLSRDRLTVHNIPPTYDSMKLRKVVEANTKLKPKECRIMRENNASVGAPNGKSKGFGFLSFKTHEDALMCLRKLNNNPNIFGKNNRPIVAFSIEDKTVHNIKEKRKARSQQKNPLFQDKQAKRKQDRKIKRQNRIIADKDKTELKPILSNLMKSAKPKKLKPTALETSELAAYTGVTTERGVTKTLMRPNWKLKEQTALHNKTVSELKKEQRKKKEKRQLDQEKREVDRTKIRKRNQVDNFSFMVDKYKKLIDSNSESGRPAQQIKRSKWYSE